MGYTHYWRRNKIISSIAMEHIVADFKKVMLEIKKKVGLAGLDGTGKPVINTKEVLFNGRRGRTEDLLTDHSCETFQFARIMKLDKSCKPDDKNGLYFDFCKTGRKPYDLAVTTFLVIAKHHLKDELIVNSDGESKDWVSARRLCQRVLGYGLDFNPTGKLVSESGEVEIHF